jgi:hypothetical protein
VIAPDEPALAGDSSSKYRHAIERRRNFVQLHVAQLEELLLFVE